MDEPLSRFLEALSERPGKASVARKRKTKDLGQEIVQLLDSFDDMARASFQPLTPKQKLMLEDLVLEAVEGPKPTPDDLRAIDKLLLHMTMTADEEGADSPMSTFVLGMAYERIRNKLSVLPLQP